jgi:hypothetical protein
VNKERFSKAKVRGEIVARMTAIQSIWNFEENNGTAQLRGDFYGYTEAKVAYGRLQALDELYEEFF